MRGLFVFPLFILNNSTVIKNEACFPDHSSIFLITEPGCCDVLLRATRGHPRTIRTIIKNALFNFCTEEELEAFSHSLTTPVSSTAIPLCRKESWVVSRSLEPGDGNGLKSLRLKTVHETSPQHHVLRGQNICIYNLTSADGIWRFVFLSIICSTSIKWINISLIVFMSNMHPANLLSREFRDALKYWHKVFKYTCSVVHFRVSYFFFISVFLRWWEKC